MKKDVIYIDIEDDITSIIGKVKDASAKIVALVPPKRVGVLQSVVNLKLLQRAASSANKRVVMITNDRSLTALAAGVSMPVAKNLQSKPEVASIDALEVDDNDVINGEELPVGELASTAAVDKSATGPSLSEAAKAASSSLDDETPTTEANAKATPAAKANKAKIPNFDRFRKRIFLIGGGAALLLIFLVWAIFFAPQATVTITAKTSAANLNENLTLDPAGTTDVSANIIKPLIQQIKKTASQEFTATGKKDIGTSATGSVVFSNCETSYAQTIESGTVLRQGNFDYVLNSDVTVPGGTFAPICTSPGESAAASVTASAIGPEYNAGAGVTFAVSGHSASLKATSSTAISGGTKETITVVSQEDADKAIAALASDDAASSSVEDELAGKFEKDAVIINESFKATPGTPNFAPAVGEKADKARLTIETTYTLVGLSRKDTKAYLNEKLNETIENQADRQIYSLGDNDLRFSQFQAIEGNKYIVALIATGSIGPKINTQELAKELAGKRFGEIEQTVMAIEGVDDVKVDFSPFWVNSAPKAEKIQIKFSVLNETP